MIAHKDLVNHKNLLYMFCSDLNTAGLSYSIVDFTHDSLYDIRHHLKPDDGAHWAVKKHMVRAFMPLDMLSLFKLCETEAANKYWGWIHLHSYVLFIKYCEDNNIPYIWYDSYGDTSCSNIVP